MKTVSYTHLNLVLVVIGGVVLGLGQMVQGKSKEQAGRQTFDSIAPDIVGTAFENVQMNPVQMCIRDRFSDVTADAYYAATVTWGRTRQHRRRDRQRPVRRRQ